ncbi:DUF6506 family protein [Chania multitudinisentens]|uniref:DUF6506 family protein n=1 Tax=Chania multitudinisentens TaxID=1639108 RepID=UPI0003E1289F|nr:DUF6506 family protein [Chania multitudinisentens]
MTDILKAAFIFVAPKSNAQTHSAWVNTEHVHVKTIAVSNYQQGCDILDGLYAEGIRAIELCAGFGHQGVARIVEAVAGRMAVGVVRFDIHPLLGFQSGDNLNDHHAADIASTGS